MDFTREGDQKWNFSVLSNGLSNGVLRAYIGSGDIWKVIQVELVYWEASDAAIGVLARGFHWTQLLEKAFPSDFSIVTA